MDNTTERIIKHKYSEEYRDTIERIPNRYTPALLLGIFFFVLILITLGWVIKYPDVITAEVKIVANNAPIKIVPKTSGLLLLEINTSEFVHKDTYIGVIKNPAFTEHVKLLKEKINHNIEDITKDLKLEKYNQIKGFQLGDIEPFFFNFLQAYNNYVLSITNNKYDLEIKKISKEILKLNSILRKKEEILSIKENILKIERNRISTDSILVSKESLLESKFMEEKKKFYYSLENYANLELSIMENKFLINENQFKITQITNEKEIKDQEIYLALVRNFYELKTAISSWENNYVMKSPKDGVLEFISFINNYQFVEQGVEIFSVIPNNIEFKGIVLLPSKGAGKVKQNQSVKIKLDSYPYQEFGVLLGEIESIALLPKESLYYSTIRLINGLISDNGVDLNFSHELVGIAEIITEDRRLIFRLIEKVKHAFERSKDKKNNEDAQQK